mmetsp:Transcript_43251/g.75763  ORF Transcript_43251/g.75763 Transcript_43251/m.75763 type:complete len:217 (-) Transcript_43251:174-824(-)
MFPSSTKLFIAPVSGNKNLTKKVDAYEYEESAWRRFYKTMNENYAINYSCVKKTYLQEQYKTTMQRSLPCEMPGELLCGPGQELLHIDVKTVTLDSLVNPTVPYKCFLKIDRDCPLEGVCGYFDADFKGSDGIPLKNEIRLTTKPPIGSEGQQTHWGQQAFLLDPPLECKKDDIIEFSMLILRQQSHGLLLLDTEFRHMRDGQMQGSPIKRAYYVN